MACLGVNVLYYDTLLNIHYTNDDIQSTRSTYKAFDSHGTVPMDQVKILILFGSYYLDNHMPSNKLAHGFKHYTRASMAT
jgi:hypothetical protein